MSQIDSSIYSIRFNPQLVPWTRGSIEIVTAVEQVGIQFCPVSTLEAGNNSYEKAPNSFHKFR